MENGSKTLQCLTYNTDTNEALRPFHYDEQMKWEWRWRDTSTFPLQVSSGICTFSTLFFFPPGTYYELLHCCLCYQPLDRSLVSLPPAESSQWLGYNLLRGRRWHGATLPRVRVYLWAVDMRASIRGRRTERTRVVPTPIWLRPLRNRGGWGGESGRVGGFTDAGIQSCTRDSESDNGPWRRLILSSVRWRRIKFWDVLQRYWPSSSEANHRLPHGCSASSVAASTKPWSAPSFVAPRGPV